jgi:hypothetical protein
LQGVAHLIKFLTIYIIVYGQDLGAHYLIFFCFVEKDKVGAYITHVSQWFGKIYLSQYGKKAGRFVTVYMYGKTTNHRPILVKANIQQPTGYNQFQDVKNWREGVN